MTLVINGIEVKEVPIRPSGIDFDKDGKKEIMLDSAGKRVEKIKIQGSEFKWTYEDGTECSGKTYKSFKGKPLKPFSKTAVIKSYDRIDISDIKYFISNELTYMLISKDLKEMLKEMKTEALSFKFVNRGFKVHRAVVYYDEQMDRSMMRLFRGDLRKVELPEDTETDEIKVSEDGVEEMSLDDLEV